MALHKVELAQNVLDIAFSPNGSNFAVLHEHGISTYHYQATDQKLSPPKLVRFCDFLSEDKLVRQIHFTNESIIIILVTHLLTGKDLILVTSILLDGFDELYLDNAVPISILHPLSYTTTVLWLDVDGNIGSVVITNDQKKQHGEAIVAKLPTRIQFIDAIAGTDRANPENLVYCNTSIIALAANGNLYHVKRLRDTEISLLTKGCTSFVLSFPFLIITTASHFLKFVRFNDGMNI